MISQTPSSPHDLLLSSSKQWQWQGLSVCYQSAGTEGPAVLLIHGFGASWMHWRKNIPVLSQSCQVYALDLLGFGGSAKPLPGEPLPYTFETWSQQIRDFCQEVIGQPTFLVGNSIGCVAIMQAAVDAPEISRGVALINCSIRMLHDRRLKLLPWYRRLGAPILQQVLSVRWLGHRFFNLIARPKTVRNILLQAYAQPEAVTDELVDLLMAPAREPGAADVFLAFTRYSQGPLPEELIAKLTCPALLLWGEEDPWEPIEDGRRLLANYDCVEKFIQLKQAGHCPQDEVPDAVNSHVLDWIAEHSEEA